MIQKSLQPLGEAQATKVRQWARHPDCAVFQKCLLATIADLQEQAGATLVQAVDNPNYLPDAQAHAQKIIQYQFVLDLLSKVDNGEFALFNLNLTA